MIILDKLSKTYKIGKKEVKALDKINLIFPNTGFIFITGSSGSGKTTLLNLLSGLENKSEGKILINGCSSENFKSGEFDAFRNHYIGYIHQENNLIDDFSVFDNINLSIQVQGRNTRRSKIEKILCEVGLENISHKKANELSGGQIKRVGIARALIKNPQILLADEPTSSIDKETGESLMKIFREIAKDRLVIIVSHELSFAAKYADRIIELSHGNIISDKQRVRAERFEEINADLFRINEKLVLEDLISLNEPLSKQEKYYILANNVETALKCFPENYEKITKPEAEIIFIDTIIEDKDEKKELNLPKVKISLFEIMKRTFDVFKKRLLSKIFETLIIAILFSMFLIFLLFECLSSEEVFRRTMNNENFPNFFVTEKKDIEFSSKTLEQQNIPFYEFYETSLNLKVGGSGSANTSLVFSNFTGFAEIDDLQEVGLKALYGKKALTETNEIIISDFAAFYLNNYRFFGKVESSDVPKLLYFKHEKDLIGKYLFINDDYFKITGIYQTDYSKYQREYNKNNHLAEKFLNEHCLKVYVKKGFNKLNSRFLTGSGGVYLSVPNEVAAFSDDLAPSEVRVSLRALSKLLGKEFENINVAESYLKNLENKVEIDYLINNKQIKEIFDTKDIFVSKNNIGVIFSTRHPNIEKILTVSKKYIINKKYASNSNIKDLNNNYTVNLFSEDMILEDSAILVTKLKSTSKAIIIFFLCFTILLNSFFVSKLLKVRQKEFLILRILGIRKSEVKKIFMIEVFYLFSFCGVIACIFSKIAFMTVNKLLNNTFVLLEFNFLVILTIIALLLAFYLIASLVSVFIVLRNNSEKLRG